ncbi:hypothetical protein LINPERHAP1_LOCUS18022 [Linum perenne]
MINKMKRVKEKDYRKKRRNIGETQYSRLVAGRQYAVTEYPHHNTPNSNNGCLYPYSSCRRFSSSHRLRFRRRRRTPPQHRHGGARQIRRDNFLCIRHRCFHRLRIGGVWATAD